MLARKTQLMQPHQLPHLKPPGHSIMQPQFHTHPTDLQDMSKVERAYMQLKYL